MRAAMHGIDMREGGGGGVDARSVLGFFSLLSQEAMQADCGTTAYNGQTTAINTHPTTPPTPHRHSTPAAVTLRQTLRLTHQRALEL